MTKSDIYNAKFEIIADQSQNFFYSIITNIRYIIFLLVKIIAQNDYSSIENKKLTLKSLNLFHFDMTED